MGRGRWIFLGDGVSLRDLHRDARWWSPCCSFATGLDSSHRFGGPRAGDANIGPGPSARSSDLRGISLRSAISAKWNLIVAMLLGASGARWSSTRSSRCVSGRREAAGGDRHRTAHGRGGAFVGQLQQFTSTVHVGGQKQWEVFRVAMAAPARGRRRRCPGVREGIRR